MGYCPETIVNMIVTKFAIVAAAAIEFNVNPGLHAHNNARINSGQSIKYVGCYMC